MSDVSNLIMDPERESFIRRFVSGELDGDEASGRPAHRFPNSWRGKLNNPLVALFAAENDADSDFAKEGLLERLDTALLKAGQAPLGVDDLVAADSSGIRPIQLLYAYTVINFLEQKGGWLNLGHLMQLTQGEGKPLGVALLEHPRDGMFDQNVRVYFSPRRWRQEDLQGLAQFYSFLGMEIDRHKADDPEERALGSARTHAASDMDQAYDMLRQDFRHAAKQVTHGDFLVWHMERVRQLIKSSPLMVPLLQEAAHTAQMAAAIEGIGLRLPQELEAQPK